MSKTVGFRLILVQLHSFNEPIKIYFEFTLCLLMQLQEIKTATEIKVVCWTEAAEPH